MNKIKNIKCFIFDMDGTIYHDNNLIDGSLELINYLNEKKIDYYFLTNNSSKNTKEYLIKLKSLGIPATNSNIITSGTATIQYLNSIKPKANLFIVGTNSLKKQFSDSGFLVKENPKEKIDYLVVGYDTELTYQKLVDAVYLLSKNVKYIATHPDLLYPAKDNLYYPDCGLFTHMLKVATGRKPLVIGKPQKAIFEAIIFEKGYKKTEAMMLGDRLYTDIKGALNANILAGLVLTGETKEKDLEKTTYKPTYVFNSIKDLYLLLKENKD